MKSKTDWARLKAGAGDARPTPEHQEADVKHIVRGLVRKGLKPLPAKASISLRVDQDVLEWFKAQVDAAGGGNYQTLINAALLDHIRNEAEPLEKTLRRVLREELKKAG